MPECLFAKVNPVKSKHRRRQYPTTILLRLIDISLSANKPPSKQLRPTLQQRVYTAAETILKRQGLSARSSCFFI
ncbi:hypothetical protein K239x_48440 [Planctomycetes bacterium K23_9]|uniref:Uncharacterized protein n=1 Tax=Stieleria marina TaxID=1930275 RepID=A0A517P0D5_9BACT|nr:hypothetical protein K239x_48440 [Planctomycetes bacterium K23_9]